MGNKKILVTSTDVMMVQFLLPHIQNLEKKGYHLTLGCSSAEGYENEGYLEQIRSEAGPDVTVKKIRTSRHPYAIKNILGLYDLKLLMKENYDLVWTNEPVMGVMTRIAANKCRKRGTVVMYMAHGFHFFKGAPKSNWMFYYIEKCMSKKCDYITVINWEDYALAEKKFLKPVFHINGIGVDYSRLNHYAKGRQEKRKELGIKDTDFVVLSVGELHDCKNHKSIIKAIARLKDNSIKYYICGQGKLKNKLQKCAEKHHIGQNVFFLGHRYDIPEVLRAADVFAHPSKREGLGIAALEAMAAGLPVIASNSQGLKDFVFDHVNGFVCSPDDVAGYARAIKRMKEDNHARMKMAQECVKTAQKYCRENAVKEVEAIIEKILNINKV